VPKDSLLDNWGCALIKGVHPHRTGKEAGKMGLQILHIKRPLMHEQDIFPLDIAGEMRVTAFGQLLF